MGVRLALVWCQGRPICMRGGGIALRNIEMFTATLDHWAKGSRMSWLPNLR